ncbi:nucleotide exchange factor GrpE [Donghicola sp. C2-DW-16]|uniref:Protein GrpE n=1 Tax=Donghicola mangrovi TaxID=2729614 RepID=A0A850Q046_9RHOB|nr:nucleotide exchange factor GrpE [Donghicola mangrovi]NVO22374.1 nucleotide exchange factor GrpE [Donghicola mangrovi]NVO26035.1 nucleotide exchange factor GrpE [Donghicola mangrovi]
MAEPKNDDFLDDVEALEEELYGEDENEELIDIDAEAAKGEALDALKAERDEYKDRYVRALAEAENARKRADKDRRDAEKYGSTRLARDLIGVYDNLQRALKAAEETSKEDNAILIEGVELTLRELNSVFSKHGLIVVEPSVGDQFDANVHEAMFEAPVPNTKKGEIIQVSAVGFMLHERLLRAAQVGVSSNPA